MQVVGLWVGAVAALALGCGSTKPTPGGSDAGGAAGSSAAGGAAGNGAKAGAANGGGASGSGDAGATSAGSSPQEPASLDEADPAEPCETDPLADHWIDTQLDLTGQDTGHLELGAGGPLALLVTRSATGLEVRTSQAGEPFSRAESLPDSTAADDYPEKVEVSADGSTAAVLWRRGQELFVNLRQENGEFAAARALTFPQEVDMVALPEQRVLFGYGGGEGIQVVEYTLAGGLVPATPIFSNYHGMARDGIASAVVFARSGLVAEPDAAYPYIFGSGFGAKEPLTASTNGQSISQTFFFAFTNGRAMRLTRTWQEEETRGLHVTTRTNGAWDTEEHISAFEGVATLVPTVAASQNSVLVAWEDKDANVAVVREHDGAAWHPEQALPRSRALQDLALVGSETSALLYGDQTLPDENISVRKLYRRGEGGTWYCAKLLPSGFTEGLASDGTGFWVAARARSQLYLSHFEP